MRLRCICFTQRGETLAGRTMDKLENWQTELSAGYGPSRVDLCRWTAEAFSAWDALLFVGATGIAVRAVAPHLRGKAVDPAVLVMDEAGRFVIPLAGGHIGGANRLALQLATLTGGQAVLTTATDVRGVFAVDEWATRRGLCIHNPRRIKAVSARLLRGETVALYSALPVRGPLPAGVLPTGDRDRADILLSPFQEGDRRALRLIPRCVAVGIGCKKGISAAVLEIALHRALARAGVLESAVCAVHTIDRKAAEPGLLALCRRRGWKLHTHTAAQLRQVAGSSAASPFVEAAVGVDNVCERSALAGGGRLLLPKQAGGGVTVALALREQQIDFEG